jgi:hypothetical protein
MERPLFDFPLWNKPAGITGPSSRIGIEELTQANYYYVTILAGGHLEMDPVEVNSFTSNLPAFLNNTDSKTRDKFLTDLGKALVSGSYDLVGNLVNEWVATIEVDAVPDMHEKIERLSTQINDGDYVEWDSGTSTRS